MVMIEGHTGEQPEGGWWMGWHCTRCGDVGHKTGFDTERQAITAFGDANVEHILAKHAHPEPQDSNSE